MGQHLFMNTFLGNFATGTGKKGWCDRGMNMKNNRLKFKTSEKTTDCSRKIYVIHLKVIKKIRIGHVCVFPKRAMNRDSQLPTTVVTDDLMEFEKQLVDVQDFRKNYWSFKRTLCNIMNL